MTSFSIGSVPSLLGVAVFGLGGASKFGLVIFRVFRVIIRPERIQKDFREPQEALKNHDSWMDVSNTLQQMQEQEGNLTEGVRANAE